MATKIIHKQGRKTIEVYAGLGQYVNVKIPLCVTAKHMWENKNKSWCVHRNWSQVTCKHCLKIKDKTC